MALALTGCSNTLGVHVWTDRALAAETLEDDGELQEAEEAYDALMASAPDRERRRWMAFDLADIARARGDDDLALTRYRSVYEEEDRDRYGARAMLRAGELEAKQGDRAQAMTLWRGTIGRYPDEVAAEDALDRIVEALLAGGDEFIHQSILAELGSHYEAVGQSLIGDNLLFRMARYRDQAMGDPDAALATYQRILDEHPDGALADDALWEAASLYIRHQRWAAAVAVLHRLTTDVEASWFVGSYASDWLDDGIFELGRIHLLHLDDYEAAIAYFERFIAEFPASMLTDDAGWHIVEARRLQGVDSAYRASLSAFVARFPYSRHVATAKARLATPSAAAALGGER